MKTNLRLLFTLLFVVSVVALRAGTMNDIRVSGTVVSEGDPLPGVSVLVKGTGVGTITGIDGKYSINVPSDGTLVFSFIGLKSVEHKVGGRSVINVELVPDSKQLEEVMVVAYATAKKYSFTGAASTVKGDEIAKLQTSSVSRALEGTVAGLQASAASGQPGTDATIRIRGIGSINASSAPLYVVDGVPYDGSVNSINPRRYRIDDRSERCGLSCFVRFAWSQRCDYYHHQAGTKRFEDYSERESQLRWFQSCGT